MNNLNTWYSRTLAYPVESDEPTSQRTLWSQQLEAATNIQINIELRNFAAYQALAAILGHATVGYPKLTEFFNGEADEEIKHARQFIDYQNMRGGKVALESITPVNIQHLYDSENLVQASYEVALQLEKDTYVALLDLHKLCDDDPQYADFVDEILKEQLGTQQSLNNKIQQLQRAGSSVTEYIEATK